MLPPIENLRDLPPAEVAERLLAEPEGQWFDRKSAGIGARELAETLVAVANAEGGLIAIGLSGGVCEGVDGRPAAQNETTTENDAKAQTSERMGNAPDKRARARKSGKQ